jgi:hypothetical protein
MRIRHTTEKDGDVLFTKITDRVLSALAPKATAQAYYVCEVGRYQYCRNHNWYVYQCCGECPVNDPAQCDLPSCGYIDYGGC